MNRFDATTLELDAKWGTWSVGVCDPETGEVYYRCHVLSPDANGRQHGGLVWVEGTGYITTPKVPLSREEAERAVREANDLFAQNHPALGEVYGDPSPMERFCAAAKVIRGTAQNVNLAETLVARMATSMVAAANSSAILEQGRRDADTI